MRVPIYKLCEEKNVEKLHETALHILETKGSVIKHPKMLEILSAHGAKVDAKTQCVRFPRAVVEKALKSLPAKFTLHDRNGKPSLRMGEGNGYLASGHGALNTIDFESGKRRPASRDDMEKFAFLSDALTNIDFVAMVVMPGDVAPKASALHAAYAAFKNTTKHFYFSPDIAESLPAIFDLARIVSGEKDLARKPVISMQLSPTSPLTWSPEALEILLASAKAGVPFTVLSDVMPGASGPITLAGTIALNHAEVVTGLVLAQMARPGTPVIYSTAASEFDMRVGNMATAAPEVILTAVATVQLAKRIRVPIHTCAPETESHADDQQQAWEKTMTTFLPMLSGGDILVNGGMFSSGMTAGFEQLIIDDELYGYLRRFIRGFEINTDTLAVDTIQNVEHGGSFLAVDHTLKHLRSGEHWDPGISNRAVYDVWNALPAKTLAAKAHAKAAELFKTHQPQRLPDDKLREMEKVIADF